MATLSSPLALTIKTTTNDAETVLGINQYSIKKAGLIIRALNHNLRKEIIKIIAKDNKLTVTELYNSLKIEQSVASQHLAILRRSGVLIRKREGKFIFYSINHARIDEINTFIKSLVEKRDAVESI